jgi:hypothetical protein
MKTQSQTSRPAGNGHHEAAMVGYQRIRDLLVKAAAPAETGFTQRARFLDVLAEVDRFMDRYPDARSAEVTAIRQITVRALEID